MAKGRGRGRIMLLSTYQEPGVFTAPQGAPSPLLCPVYTEACPRSRDSGQGLALRPLSGPEGTLTATVTPVGSPRGGVRVGAVAKRLDFSEPQDSEPTAHLHLTPVTLPRFLFPERAHSSGVTASPQGICHPLASLVHWFCHSTAHLGQELSYPHPEPSTPGCQLPTSPLPSWGNCWPASGRVVLTCLPSTPTRLQSPRRQPDLANSCRK